MQQEVSVFIYVYDPLVTNNDSLTNEMKSVIKDFESLIKICHQHSESDSQLVIVTESLHCSVLHNLPRQPDMFNCGLFSVAFAIGFNSSEESLEENHKININPDIQSLHCGSICNFQMIRSLKTPLNIQGFRARLTMILSEPLFHFCFPGTIAQEKNIGHDQRGFSLEGSSYCNTQSSSSTQINIEVIKISSESPTNSHSILPCPTTPITYQTNTETNDGINVEQHNDFYLDSSKYYEVHKDQVDDIKDMDEMSDASESGESDHCINMWMDDTEGTSQNLVNPVVDKQNVENRNPEPSVDKNTGMVPICIENFEKITATATGNIDTADNVMTMRLRNISDSNVGYNSTLESKDTFNSSKTFYDEFKESLKDDDMVYQDIIYPSSMDSDDSEFRLDLKTTLQTHSADLYISDLTDTSCDDLQISNADSDSSEPLPLTFDELYKAEKLREQLYKEEKKKKLEKELKADPSFKPSDPTSTTFSSGSSVDDDTSSSPDVSFSFTEEDPIWRISSLRELKAAHVQDRNCISFTSYIALLLETHPTLSKMSTDHFIKEFELEMDAVKKTVGKRKSVYSKQSWHQLPKAIKQYLEAASIMISGDKEILRKFFIDMRLSSSDIPNPNNMGKGYNGTSIDIDSLRSMGNHLGNVIPHGGSTIIMSGKNISTLKKELPKSISYKIWDNKEERGFLELKEVPHFQIMTSRNHKSKIFLCLPNFDSSETCNKSFVLKESFRKTIIDKLIIPAISAMNTPNERINFFSSSRIAMEKSRNEKGQLGNTHIDLSNKGVEQLSKRMQDIITTAEDILTQQAFDFFFLYQIDDIKQFTRVYLNEKQQTKTHISNRGNTDSNKSLPDSSHILAQYTYENGDTLYSEFLKLSDLRPSKLDTIYRLDVG